MTLNDNFIGCEDDADNFSDLEDECLTQDDFDLELVEELKTLRPQVFWLGRLIDFAIDIPNNVKYKGEYISRKELKELFTNRTIEIKQLTYNSDDSDYEIDKNYVLEREIAIFSRIYKKFLSDDGYSRDLSVMMPLKSYLQYLAWMNDINKGDAIKVFKSKRDKNELEEIYHRAMAEFDSDNPPFICTKETFVKAFSGGMEVLSQKIQWNIFLQNSNNKNKKSLACFLALMLKENESEMDYLFTAEGLKQVEVMFDTSFNRQRKTDWAESNDIEIFEKIILNKKKEIIKL